MQDWVKDLMEEWNKEWDKEVVQEWLREPKVLPGQKPDNSGENYIHNNYVDSRCGIKQQNSDY